MCNAPKFGEIEERTGYGGGYNDRGVVEYKERRDDDDEYDEFGRRRKKRKLDKGSDDDSKDSKYSSPSRSKSRDKTEADEPNEEDQEENVIFMIYTNWHELFHCDNVPWICVLRESGKSSFLSRIL